MGTPDFADAKQIPDTIYNIKTFDMSKTLVTVEQYTEYYNSLPLNSKARQLAKPDTGGYCNWGKTDRDRTKDPINCVDWNQANAYAKSKGARLPSESEYEYVATSGGKNWAYPWGKPTDPATCDKAVMNGKGGYGCGSGGTMPVCKKPAGNTQIEGLSADKQLCDMVGNVWQWIQDTYEDSYAHTPTDGSANEAGSRRVMRGGSFINEDAGYLRADYRNYGDPASRYGSDGFRLARERRD